MTNIKKKLIIFDCDGVLVDSESLACSISLAFLETVGVRMSAEENIRLLTGLSEASSRAVLEAKFQISLPIDFHSKQREMFMERCKTELKGLMEPVLKEIKMLDVSFCVASSSNRDRVLSSLSLTNQLQFFKESHIFTASQVKNGKPAPDLFLFAANEMAVSPADCLVIEDSFAGVQAAKSANMKVIGFLGGGHAKHLWDEQRIVNEKIPFSHDCSHLIEQIRHFMKE